QAGATFAEQLVRNREMILDAYAHQDVPFEMLVESLRPERSLRHAAVVQVKLDLQNNEAGRLSLPGLSLSPLRSGVGLIDKDLYVNAIEGGGRLSLSWQFRADIFDRATLPPPS